jgi:hypothetical protein
MRTDQVRVRYASRGRLHFATSCPGAPLEMSCVGCHRSDDIHGGQFGAQCDRCHETRIWREIKSLGRRSSLRSWLGTALSRTPA